MRTLGKLLVAAVTAAGVMMMLTASVCVCGYSIENRLHLRIVDDATGDVIADPAFPDNQATCAQDAGAPCQVWILIAADSRSVTVRATGYEDGRFANAFGQPPKGTPCGEPADRDGTVRLKRASPDAGTPVDAAM